MDTIKHKHSKLRDVKYCWLTEKQAKNYFDIYRDCGSNILVDYPGLSYETSQPPFTIKMWEKIMYY